MRIKNSYTACLDRLSHKRKDDKWINEQLESDNSKFVLLKDLNNFFSPGKESEPLYLSAQDLINFRIDTKPAIFLGISGDSSYFALDFKTSDSSTRNKIQKLGHFQFLRKYAAFLSEFDFNILAHTRGMVYWHHRLRFCGNCGSPTKSLEAGNLIVCTNKECGQSHFPRTDPAIIVLVTLGESCLLGIHKDWPKGMFSTIAGFVEPGERAEDSVAREVFEETGIKVKSIKYFSSQPWPFPSSLMLGFTAEAVNKKIKIDENELESAFWFTREDIKEKILNGSMKASSKISIAYRLIEGWFNKGDLGELGKISL